MPVTFKVDALITAAKDAVTVGTKAQADWEKAAGEYRKAKIAESDARSNIVALRDELSAFIETRKTPTYADAQRFKKAARSDYLSLLYATEVSDPDVRNNVPRPSGWYPVATLDSWRGLVRMLEAHTEDTITANQLKLFGYDKLEPLFRQAAMISSVTDPK